MQVKTCKNAAYYYYHLSTHFLFIFYLFFIYLLFIFYLFIFIYYFLFICIFLFFSRHIDVHIDIGNDRIGLNSRLTDSTNISCG